MISSMISGRPEKGGGEGVQKYNFHTGIERFHFSEKRTDRFANGVERKNVVFKRLFFF